MTPLNSQVQLIRYTRSTTTAFLLKLYRKLVISIACVRCTSLNQHNRSQVIAETCSAIESAQDAIALLRTSTDNLFSKLNIITITSFNLHVVDANHTQYPYEWV
jgi:urease accessory protein UreF